jgi:hypothetical protein
MVPRNRKIDFLGIVLVAGLALSSGPAFAAEKRSADDIINALKPRVTRGLTTSPADAARAADETRFLDALRNRPTRSLSTEERDQIASIASSKPKIDLEINFEFNSAVIGSKAMPQVTELGKALRSADLKGRTFILAVSRRSARSRTKKPDAADTSEMHRCISPDKQQRPGWKETFVWPTVTFDRCCSGARMTPHRSGQAGAEAEPRASRPALVR